MINVNEYAKALFELTEEMGTTERVREDVIAARAVFAENPDYAGLLDTPALKKDERVRLVGEAFSSLDEMLVNLIKLVCEKRESYAINKLFEAYLERYDETRGIERVVAITALAMSDEQLISLKKKLEGITKKTVFVKNEVDPAILGGVKLRYMGRQLDGSLKSRLDTFEKKLRETVV
jgi:ATP synthase F1 delta subunit